VTNFGVSQKGLVDCKSLHVCTLYTFVNFEVEEKDADLEVMGSGVYGALQFH
jgi:hypothetical protein